MNDILHLESRSRIYDEDTKSAKYYETISKIKAEREAQLQSTVVNHSQSSRLPSHVSCLFIG